MCRRYVIGLPVVIFLCWNLGLLSLIGSASKPHNAPRCRGVLHSDTRNTNTLPASLMRGFFVSGALAL